MKNYDEVQIRYKVNRYLKHLFYRIVPTVVPQRVSFKDKQVILTSRNGLRLDAVLEKRFDQVSSWSVFSQTKSVYIGHFYIDMTCSVRFELLQLLRFAADKS